jgi:hypothetical protein
MMNADASALMVMTILALGTFIAGNYSSGGWRISLVGFQLALGGIVKLFDVSIAGSRIGVETA